MDHKKVVAISQSNYIPWKGYFDIIQNCSCFVFLDDVQYTRRDWRNRNKINTPQGPSWLTIPVQSKGNYANLRILDVEVSENDWAEKHWNMIQQNYRKAPFFAEIQRWLQPLYVSMKTYTSLSAINQSFIAAICSYLSIPTHFQRSTDFFDLQTLDAFSPTERLLEICKKMEATSYISGPAAQSYMDIQLFEKEKIVVHWANYSNYPDYPQQMAFEHSVSIIDMLMNVGPQTKNYLKGASLL
ncbi:MAG: WbqC family protein [Bdellovibrionota bacterium]